MFELRSKKALNILICISILFSTLGCNLACATTLEEQKKETREKINRLKWLESLETNKLYKNQQKLESANTNLARSKKQIIEAQKQLLGLQGKLEVASAEYNHLNNILSAHVRKTYKTQRKAMFEAIISSKDINMFMDRLHFKKLIIQDDFNKMAKARAKAQEISTLRNNIERQKRNLERSIVSINSQQSYIEQAINKNEKMIEKLRTDRIAYQKAEQELARQSASIGSYINKSAKDSSVQVASGFIKPIQGRITSAFGWRTHPVFNTRSFHSGIDIGGPNYGEIRASNSGKVIYSGWYGGYGKVVILEHGVINGKPITTLYAHMSSILVSNGQRVNKGQVIGKEGTTGYSTGPHCHFEVRVNGQPNNPLNYI